MPNRHKLSEEGSCLPPARTQTRARPLRAEPLVPRCPGTGSFPRLSLAHEQAAAGLEAPPTSPHPPRTLGCTQLWPPDATPAHRSLQSSTCFFYSLLMYFEREREGARAGAGERQRERERAKPQQGLPCQHRARYGAPSHNAGITTRAEVKGPTLNRLSHPGALQSSTFEG